MAARLGSRLTAIKPSLYVGNIPWTVGNQDLKEYFNKFSQVVRANVVFDKATGYHKGFGFVVLKDKEALKTVLQENEHKIGGRIVEVKIKENQPF